jgi:PAS domain S-box-containing protein
MAVPEHPIEAGAEIARDREAEPGAPAQAESYAAQLRDFLEHTNDAVHASDAEHRIVFVNRRWTETFGWTREEAAGLTIFDIVHPDFREVSRSNVAVLATLPDLAPQTVERAMITRAGATLLAEGTVSARFVDGRFAGTRAFFRDVTARRRDEEQLRRSRDELAAANAALAAANAALAAAGQSKDDFLANMSHELRTPLNAVMGLSEALEERVYGPLTDAQLAPVRRIGESGRHLLEVISEILDFSKAEAGKLTLDVDSVVVEDLCRTALRLVQEPARKKRLRLAMRLEDGFVAVQGDGRRLRQVVVNLLSNAVKFTPEGGSIGIDASADEDLGVARLTVWDTGIGIAREQVGRIFEPFVQLDSRLSRQHAGTGLGLSLVARLVALHGGNIEVESEPGKGSRFTVVLRIEGGPARLSALPVEPASAPRRRPRRRARGRAGPSCWPRTTRPTSRRWPTTCAASPSRSSWRGTGGRRWRARGRRCPI